MRIQEGGVRHIVPAKVFRHSRQRVGCRARVTVVSETTQPTVGLLDRNNPIYMIGVLVSC